MGRRITLIQTGMTKRNKDRLRPLNEERRLFELYTLPGLIHGEVLRAGVPTHGLALQLQAALVIKLLIMMPMRIKKLAALRLGTRIFIGRYGHVTLVLPTDEVKNGVEAEAVLPATTAELLDLYLTHYRPLLTKTPSDAATRARAATRSDDDSELATRPDGVRHDRPTPGKSAAWAKRPRADSKA